MRIGYIYKLICPKTNGIRYIGQTTKPLKTRLSRHINSAKYLNKKNYKLNHKSTWIINLIDIGKINMLKIELIEEISSEELVDGFNRLDEREIYWIEYHKKIGCSLVNHSLGGKLNNIKKSHIMRKTLEDNLIPKMRPKVTDQTKLKISIANSGSNNGMYGKSFKRTNVQKDKLSKSLLNSEKLKESRKSKEYREKISNFVSVPVYVLNEKFEIVHEFKNSTKCADFFGFTRGNIKNAIRDLRRIGKSMNEKYWIVRKENYAESIIRIKERLV